MPKTDAVVIDNVSKHFGALTALSEVSLNIGQGSFFGLLGPNGAGKTTLIGVLGGLVTASHGRVRVLGHDVRTAPLKVRSIIGIVPQEPVYDPFFNVHEALRFQSKYYGLHRNQAWIDTLLENLQLTDKIKVNTRKLSGGMKRRLMIAQALVHKPPVIVLDEPTAGVDINLRLSLWSFIRELNKDGHTIILTTHYLEEAEALCDEVALMNQGKIITHGKTRELLSPVEHAARLRVRIDGGELPAELSPETREGHHYLFNIRRYDDIEPLLASLRRANLTLSEVTVSPPRLEDVFIRLMRAP